MMDEDDGEFYYNLSTDDEKLLIQLTKDAETKEDVARAIDTLPARSDIDSGLLKQHELAVQSADKLTKCPEVDASATTLLLLADGEIRSAVRM